MDNLLENQISSRVVIVILIVFTLLIIECYWLGEQKNKSLSIISPLSQKSPSKYTIKPLTFDELKKLLPYKFPLEQNVQIVRSFKEVNIDRSNGTVQINYQFVSKKTPTENFNLYKTYLERNNWKLQNIINETDIKSLSAAKEAEQKKINITISKNILTGQNIIDISLIHSFIAVYKIPR